VQRRCGSSVSDCVDRAGIDGIASTMRRREVCYRSRISVPLDNFAAAERCRLPPTCVGGPELRSRVGPGPYRRLAPSLTQTARVIDTQTEGTARGLGLSQSTPAHKQDLIITSRRCPGKQPVLLGLRSQSNRRTHSPVFSREYADGRQKQIRIKHRSTLAVGRC
jgi:hypothetical protein